MKNKRSLAKLARLFCGSKESFSETEKPPIIDVQLLGAVHNAGSLVCLGRVDLSWLNFVRDKSVLIAARGK